MRFLASSASNATQADEADKAKRTPKAPKSIAQMVAENSPWSKAAVGTAPVKHNFSNAVVEPGGPTIGPIQTKFGMTVATPTPFAPIAPPMFGIGAAPTFTPPGPPNILGGTGRAGFDLSRACMPGMGGAMFVG